MCGINPVGGLLTSKTGRAAALGGIAGSLIAGGGKKKKSGQPQVASDGTADPRTGMMS